MLLVAPPAVCTASANLNKKNIAVRIFNKNDINQSIIAKVNTSKDIKSTKKQITPPILSISNINFNDKNSNNRIDGSENCSIEFTIKNKGRGQANDLKAYIHNKSNIKGLIYKDTVFIGNIDATKEKAIKSEVNIIYDVWEA